MNIQRKVLVLGNGRAGKRHVKSAQQHGLAAHTYDPYAPADYDDLKDIPYFAYDYAVIASPPDQHLQQLQWLVDNGLLRIMCEKPLCSMAESDFLSLTNDLPVMVAYNWYYNKQVQFLVGSNKNYSLFAEQSRILPVWGIENDHLPHDLFIINYISGGIKEIKYCSLVKSNRHQEIYVEGKSRSGDFTITERVLLNDVPRISKVNDVNLIPDSQMFDDMWSAFLRQDYTPSLKDGIHVQNLLHDVYSELKEQGNACI